DLAALKPIVDSLLAQNLMFEVTPAGRGQVVSHNLYLPAEKAALLASPAGGAGERHVGAEPARDVAPAPSRASADDLAALRGQVAEREARVRAIEARLGSTEGGE